MWSTGRRCTNSSRLRAKSRLARLFLDAHVRLAFFIVADCDAPRLAAHLAVLDVLLHGAAARVEGDLVLLAAVRARHGDHGVGAAVARVEVFRLVVEIVDHGTPKWSCCRLAGGTSGGKRLTATAARVACTHGTARRISPRGRPLPARSRASASPRARARAGSAARRYSTTPRRRWCARSSPDTSDCA